MVRRTNKWILRDVHGVALNFFGISEYYTIDFLLNFQVKFIIFLKIVNIKKKLEIVEIF